MKIAAILSSAGNLIARIPCNPPRTQDEVHFLLSIVLAETVDESNYCLEEKARKGRPASFPLLPKHYVLNRIDNQPVTIEKSNNLPTLFPRTRRGSVSSAGSSTSMSALETSSSETIASVIAQIPPEEVARYAKFAFQLSYRDRGCILTGNDDVDGVVGAHLIPHSWKRQAYQGLPEDVKEQLTSTELGIDDVTNGLLISGSYHKSFDSGLWSVVWTKNGSTKWESWNDPSVGQAEEGRYMVVGLSSRAPQEILGKFLRYPVGIKNSGCPWVEDFPPAVLWKFHFTTAVYKNIRGAADADVDGSDEPDMRDLIFYRSLVCVY